jgi:DNA-binding MarR family transcriptional regulator
VTQTSPGEDDVDAAMAVLGAMVGIADATVEHVTGQLTLTQFHALRIVSGQPPVTMGTVAQELAMNPSSVTRACDKLVGLGLLHSTQNPLDKREVLLAPTERGEELVAQVSQDRRRVLADILRRLDPGTRADVVTGLACFAAAAEAPSGDRSGVPG